MQVGGKKLYEVARKGQEVERQPRAVTGVCAVGARLDGLTCAQLGLCSPRLLPRRTVDPAHAPPPRSLLSIRHPRTLPPRLPAPRCLAVERFDLRRDEVDRQSVHFSVVCSKGTYIRSLAADLGRALGTAAHLTALRREAIGEYRVQGAWQVQDLADQLHRQRMDRRAAQGEAGDVAVVAAGAQGQGQAAASAGEPGGAADAAAAKE